MAKANLTHIHEYFGPNTLESYSTAAAVAIVVFVIEKLICFHFSYKCPPQTIIQVSSVPDPLHGEQVFGNNQQQGRVVAIRYENNQATGLARLITL